MLHFPPASFFLFIIIFFARNLPFIFKFKIFLIYIPSAGKLCGDPDSFGQEEHSDHQEHLHLLPGSLRWAVVSGELTCSLYIIEEGYIKKKRQRLLLLFAALFCTWTILRTGWIHSFLDIMLVQFILFFKSSWCIIASMERNWINSVPQTAMTTFLFSSVFIILILCFIYLKFSDRNHVFRTFYNNIFQTCYYKLFFNLTLHVRVFQTCCPPWPSRWPLWTPCPGPGIWAPNRSPASKNALL